MLDIVVTGGLLVGALLSVVFVLGSVALLVLGPDAAEAGSPTVPDAARRDADVISLSPRGRRTAHLPARSRGTGRSAA